MNNYEHFSTIRYLITNRPDQLLCNDDYQILYQAYLKQFEKLVKQKYYYALTGGLDFSMDMFKGYPNLYTAAENDIIGLYYKQTFKEKVQQGNLDFINIIFKTKPHMYTNMEYQFMDDAEKGEPLQKYIDDGIDVNIVNNYALRTSCHHQFYDNAKLLLDNGANIHAVYI